MDYYKKLALIAIRCPEGYTPEGVEEQIVQNITFALREAVKMERQFISRHLRYIAGTFKKEGKSLQAEVLEAEADILDTGK